MPSRRKRVGNDHFFFGGFALCDNKGTPDKTKVIRALCRTQFKKPCYKKNTTPLGERGLSNNEKYK